MVARLSLSAYLGFKLARAGTPPSEQAAPAPVPVDRIKIAAVQWLAEPVKNPNEWTERVEALFRAAAAAHCHLVVFPEYLPMSLLGLIMPETAGAHTLTDATVAEVLKGTARPLYTFWVRWMAAFARKYGLVTVAGSGLVLERGRLYNQTVWLDAQGRMAGRQSKMHPLPDERRWGVVPATGPLSNPMQPWGLAGVVCNDATYFESFRMLAHKGARVIAVPIADPESRYTVGKARRGCFSAVQDVPMVGVVSAATGRLFGMRLTGKAGIYLPEELTPDSSGVLAESLQPVGEGLVTGVVSLAQLSAFRERHQASHPVPPDDFMDALYHNEEAQQC
ncbi:nitrilase-related carbon-nitrogen hydrolase [Sulfobacillus harzensis]|uniref:CN hydrolase domain-containing protein n=1 Tax=Sulfobacillus harzensis TaxID=2729629 RepID=A0A7Y0L0Q5_9FIRM|nr:nitrilase-related carbon-nitrogen hydrolase [Sulfobacillus harzensis]NMP20827.1 hypothetical protein [Sulfobacillus harzensis]